MRVVKVGEEQISAQHSRNSQSKAKVERTIMIIVSFESYNKNSN